MQIRSQYLIQDNHNDYTSEPLPSHGPSVSASSRVHTCARPAARYLPTLLFAGRTLILFTPSPSPAPALPLRDPCTLGSWKCCLDAPRRPAGSRGKNATLLIIKYARDAVWEGRTGGRGRDLCVIRGCTVWFGSTSPERSTKEFRPQEIPMNFSEGCLENSEKNFNIFYLSIMWEEMSTLSRNEL